MQARMVDAKAFLQLVLFVCALGAALGQQNKYPFSTQPWNIKADVLILDVGSLFFQGNHPMFPPFNQDGCADACARTPGCNAWTYCSSKEGCGSGCKAYVAQNPSVTTASGPEANPTIPNPAWKSLPRITGFGPWGVTGNCKYECDASGSCKPSDKWPYGMCSLKKLANADKPEYWSNNAADGFVSGFAKQPPECANIPIRACTRCLRSKSPANCLKCANNPAFQLGMLEGTTSSLTKADGCSSCYDSSDPAKCIECLTSNAPCAQCALQQPDASVQMDVTACIDCTQKHGVKFGDACMQCSFLGAKQQQMTQCLSCLDAMKPLACDKTDYQPGCWNPTVSSHACATCARDAQSFDTCLDCMKSSPYSANCEYCALLDSSGKQETCYRCSKAAAHPGSGCHDCLQNLSDPGQLGQCLGCLANPKIGKEGKQWCWGCQNWCNTYATRGQCVACLGTPQDAYMTACACSK